MHLDSSPKFVVLPLRTLHARRQTYGDIENGRRRLPRQFARSPHDRQRSRDSQDTGGELYSRSLAERRRVASGNEVLAIGGCMDDTKGAPFSSLSPPSPPPLTTSQLTCFSYFQDSRGEVKLALLPPCNLPLRHYHSTAAAPMHLSRYPIVFLPRNKRAHYQDAFRLLRNTDESSSRNELSDYCTRKILR